MFDEKCTQTQVGQRAWHVSLPLFLKQYCMTIARAQNVKPQKVLQALIRDGMEHREQIAEQLKVR